MEPQSTHEPEEEATPRGRPAHVAGNNCSRYRSSSLRLAVLLADPMCSSCGCGFDGIVRYGRDLFSSIKVKALSQRWEWLQRTGSGDSASSRCASAACARNVMTRRDEADITEHREQLKEQAKESLLRAHQAEHDVSVLQARQEEILAQLATKEKDLEMANRKVEIAEQDKEKRLRQLEEDLDLVLKEKEEMQSTMERRQNQLIRERDEAMREIASLERPWWRRLSECHKLIPCFPCDCYPYSTCMRRMMMQCCLIEKTMQLMRLPNPLSRRSCLDCFPVHRNTRNLLAQESTPRLQRANSYHGAADEVTTQNPYTDSARVDLINALLKSEWSYVSEWFEQQMRDVVEPLLQEQLAAMIPGIKINIGHTCDLGDTPVQLENIVAETCTEVMPDGGEKIENLQICGSLNYLGNAMVDVGVSEFGGEIGSLFVTGLQVQGSVVIELVKLTHAPPWFSGVRIFFPNAPKIDIHLNTKLRGVGSVEAIGTVIKDKIVQALDEKVLGRKVVLPNRFCIGLGERMEDVSLRYPRPQGVLRLAVLRARGLRNTRSGSSWYSPFSKKIADDENVNPYVVLTLGSERKQTRQCTKTLTPEWENEIFDFVVTDFAKQSLRFTVRDHESGLFSASDHLLGRREIPLTELTKVSLQQRERWVSLLQRPEERWVSLYSETGWLRVGHLMIQAQWRPCAQVNEITQALTALDNWWGIGVRSEVCWLLAADIFYASGLPHCDEGTEHWATMAISGFDSIAGDKDTPVAYAAGPFEHGLQLLGNIGLAKGVMTDEDMRQTGRTMWRKKVFLGAKATELEKKGTRLVDVVWNCPLLFLMDRVQDVKIKVSVWRPAKGGKTRLPPPSNAVEIGSFEHTLSMTDLGGRMILTLQHALGDSGAEIKLRLQASPLMAPSSSCQIPYSQRIGQAANAFCANRSLAVDFLNPEAFANLSFAPDHHPLAEGGDLRIQGIWSGGCIAGNILSWNDGRHSVIDMITPFKFTVTLGDDEMTFVATAVLEDDGKLYWSDGGIWERKVEDAASEDAQQASLRQPRGWFGWLWPKQSIAYSGDRAELPASCIGSEDERELAQVFAENSDDEGQMGLVSTNALQITRFERLRNWVYPPKLVTQPVEDQATVDLNLEVDLQRQGSGSDETAISKDDADSESEADPIEHKCEAASDSATHEVSEIDNVLVQHTVNKEVAPSAWSIVNWWKAPRKFGSDKDDRQSQSAPELRGNVSSACQNDLESSESSQEAPLEDGVIDIPPMLHSRESRGMNKRAASHPNLVASEEDRFDFEIANDDRNVPDHTDSLRTPPRRHWLGFRRKSEPSVDSLTDSNKSTFTAATPSDSYDSASHTLALLSPSRGTIQFSSTPGSAPKTNDDVGEDAGCQPPVFTGEDTVGTRTLVPIDDDRPQEDERACPPFMDPSEADFGTPDVESKEEVSEPKSPIKSVLSLFRKH